MSHRIKPARPPLTERQFEFAERAEQTSRHEAGEAMLAALRREHPERATISNPVGTEAPRRLPIPTTGGIKTNFDG